MEEKDAMRIRSLTVTITAITIGFAFLFAQEAAAQTSEIRVLASNAVKAVMEDIRPQCERTTGHPLVVEFNTTASLKERIEAGEAFDVAIFTSEVMDDLIKEGKIAGGTRADVSRVGIGIGRDLACDLERGEIEDHRRYQYTGSA
jgi:molybdate transport system substrate-binding protein